MPPLSDALLDRFPHPIFVVEGVIFEWANQAGAALLGTTSEALAGTNIGDVLAEGEFGRIASRIRLVRRGIGVPDSDRVRFLDPASKRELAVDIQVVRLDEEGLRAMLVCAPPTPPTHAEAVFAKLAKLAPVSDSVVSLTSLFARVSPVFAELGWRAFLIEPHGDVMRAEHVANIEGDDPIARYAQGLRHVSIPTSEVSITTEVLRSGEPVYIDDYVSRLSTAPGITGHSARFLGELSAKLRAAWVPVPGPTGPAAVLLVIGTTISPEDSIALRLFTAQIAATKRIEQMRAELVRRERLAAVGEMSAVLAHEVRNPLAIVANAGATLRRILGSSVTSDAKRLLDILDEETARLNRLVRDLLAFARPSDPQIAVVTLDELIHGAIGAVVLDPIGDPTLAESTSVTIAADAAFVRADPELLHGALVNVLLNAAQHRTPQSVVHIDATRHSAREVAVRFFNESERLSDEARDRVFDPFFTTRPHGTGLGLAVVRRTLEDVGGRVEVNAAPDGFAVSLYLPVAE